MPKFVLTAEMNLRGPKDAARVVRQLNSQLKGVNVDVQVKGASRARQEMDALAQSTERTTKAGSELGRVFQLSIKRFAAFSIATRTVGLLTGGLSRAFDEAVSFERELIKISQVTGKTVKQLSGLSKEIDRLATTWGVASASLLGVTRILSQAGLTARDTQIALETLAKTELSPTFDDLEQTTEGVVAVFNQFQAGAEALESQLGSMNAVAGKFAVESGDLISVVRRVGGVFKSSGGSLNELLALFTSVRATTRESAESIATGLRTIFVRIQRPKTLRFLEEMGVRLTDLEGRFVGPYEAVKRLNAQFAKLDQGDPRFIQVAEEIAGFRQIGKVIPLLQQFQTVAESALDVANKGGDSLTKDALTAQASLAIQIIKVKEEFLLLVREIYSSPVFKLMAESSLAFASAILKVASALKDLIPLIAAVGAFKGFQLLGGFASGLTNRFNSRERFATGGSVPGVGNGDTVPAMLTPGEYVINKRSAQSIGYNKLAQLNSGGAQYLATGGIVGASTSITKGKLGATKKVNETITDEHTKYIEEQYGKAIAEKFTKSNTSWLQFMVQEGLFNVGGQGKPKAIKTQNYAKGGLVKGGVQHFVTGGLVADNPVEVATLLASLNPHVRKALEDSYKFVSKGGNIEAIPKDGLDKQASDLFRELNNNLAKGKKIIRTVDQRPRFNLIPYNLEAINAATSDLDEESLKFIGKPQELKNISKKVVPGATHGGPAKSRRVTVDPGIMATISVTGKGDSTKDMEFSKFVTEKNNIDDNKLSQMFTNSEGKGALKFNLQNLTQSNFSDKKINGLTPLKAIQTGLEPAVKKLLIGGTKLLGATPSEDIVKTTTAKINKGALQGHIFEGILATFDDNLRLSSVTENFDFYPQKGSEIDTAKINKLITPGIQKGVKLVEAKTNIDSASINGPGTNSVYKKTLNELLSGRDHLKASDFTFYNSGGTVPGTGSSDTVPAMLTPGEYVINKRAVQSLGVGTLHNLNSGKISGYNKGGVVKGGVQHFLNGGAVLGASAVGGGLGLSEAISSLTTVFTAAAGAFYLTQQAMVQQTRATEENTRAQNDGNMAQRDVQTGAEEADSTRLRTERPSDATNNPDIRSLQQVLLERSKADGANLQRAIGEASAVPDIEKSIKDLTKLQKSSENKVANILSKLAFRESQKSQIIQQEGSRENLEKEALSAFSAGDSTTGNQKLAQLSTYDKTVGKKLKSLDKEIVLLEDEFISLQKVAENANIMRQDEVRQLERGIKARAELSALEEKSGRSSFVSSEASKVTSREDRINLVGERSSLLAEKKQQSLDYQNQKNASNVKLTTLDTQLESTGHGARFFGTASSRGGPDTEASKDYAALSVEQKKLHDLIEQEIRLKQEQQKAYKDASAANQKALQENKKALDGARRIEQEPRRRERSRQAGIERRGGVTTEEIRANRASRPRDPVSVQLAALAIQIERARSRFERFTTHIQNSTLNYLANTKAVTLASNGFRLIGRYIPPLSNGFNFLANAARTAAQRLSSAMQAAAGYIRQNFIPTIAAAFAGVSTIISQFANIQSRNAENSFKSGDYESAEKYRARAKQSEKASSTLFSGGAGLIAGSRYGAAGAAAGFAGGTAIGIAQQIMNDTSTQDNLDFQSSVIEDTMSRTAKALSQFNEGVISTSELLSNLESNNQKSSVAFGKILDTELGKLDLGKTLFNTLGSAGSGALLGAAAGSVIPGVGTLVGGLAGAGVGAAAGYYGFGGNQYQKEIDPDKRKAFIDSTGQNLNSILSDRTKLATSVLYDKGLDGDTKKGVIDSTKLNLDSLKDQLIKRASETKDTGILTAIDGFIKNIERTKQSFEGMEKAAKEIDKFNKQLVTIRNESIQLSSAFGRAALQVDVLDQRIAGVNEFTINQNIAESAKTNTGLSAQASTGLDSNRDQLLSVVGSNSPLAGIVKSQTETKKEQIRTANVLQAGLAGFSSSKNDPAKALGDLELKVQNELKNAGLGDQSGLINASLRKEIGSQSLTEVNVQEALNKVIESVVFNPDKTKGLDAAAKAFGEQLEKLTAQKRKIFEVESLYLQAKLKSIDLEEQSARGIEEFGGRKAKSGFEFAIDRQNTLNQGAGLNNLAGGGVASIGQGIRSARENITRNQAIVNSASDGSEQKLIATDELAKSQQALENYTATINAGVEEQKKQIELLAKKNKLEADSIDALVKGDVQEFFKKQSAKGAQAAIATGDSRLTGLYGAEALSGAIDDLKAQRDAGVTSLYGQQISGGGGLLESGYAKALEQRGITDPRLAQVAAGTDAQTEEARATGRALYRELPNVGAGQVDFAGGEVQNAQTRLITMMETFTQALGGAATTINSRFVSPTQSTANTSPNQAAVAAQQVNSNTSIAPPSAATQVSSGRQVQVPSVSTKDSDNLASFANSAQRLSDAVEKLAQSTIKVELAPSVVTVNVTASQILGELGEVIRTKIVNPAIINAIKSDRERSA